VHPLPEGNPVGDGQRRLDRAEAGDMVVADLAADAAGFAESDLKPMGATPSPVGGGKRQVMIRQSSQPAASTRRGFPGRITRDAADEGGARRDPGPRNRTGAPGRRGPGVAPGRPSPVPPGGKTRQRACGERGASGLILGCVPAFPSCGGLKSRRDRPPPSTPCRGAIEPAEL